MNKGDMSYVVPEKGDTVLAGSKMFTVGGEVFANHTCDYGGLFGTVTEIRTGPDQCTERDEPDICCDLQPPESETMVMEIKDRFSALFGYPKQLEDLGLDCVILAPSMLEPMPEDLPAEDGRLLSLTCFYDSDSGCAAQTLALSSDMGLLLRKCGRTWTPMRSRSSSPMWSGGSTAISFPTRQRTRKWKVCI